MRGPQHQQASRLSRASLRPPIAPEVVTCGAAVSACERGQQFQRNLPFLRAMRRLALGPEGFSGSAAVNVCDRRQQHQPAGHLLRGASRHAISPARAARCAASSVRRSAGSTRRPDISYERGGASVPVGSTFRAAAVAG